MATAQVVADTRNLEWKDNNVGSKLLQKMGWKDGQGIGKRRMLHKSAASDVSSEGLRVRRRADGLGLGATSNAAAHSSVSHAADFAHVLQSLQHEHGVSTATTTTGESTTKRKRSKKQAIAAMPTNKLTNARVRQAKFQTKSEDDMKCIFAGTDVFAAISRSNSCSESTKKRTRDDKGEKKQKKKNKKDKKEGKKEKK